MIIIIGLILLIAVILIGLLIIGYTFYKLLEDLREQHRG